MKNSKKEISQNKRSPMLVNLTKDQREWIEKQAALTGDSMTAIIRQSVQKQIDSK